MTRAEKETHARPPLSFECIAHFQASFDRLARAISASVERLRPRPGRPWLTSRCRTVAAPADENAAPSNVVTNTLLAGACDDDDNELTDEQKRIIEERLKALQARFKAFEEKTLKQKIDELMLANEGPDREGG